MEIYRDNSGEFECGYWALTVNVVMTLLQALLWYRLLSLMPMLINRLQDP